jgi:serine/threonine-protein phosphatase 4 catalytic subunit
VAPSTNNAATAAEPHSSSSSLDEQIERLKRCEYLKENEVKSLCLRAREILVDEGNVQRVDAPVTVSFFYHLCCCFYVRAL